MPGHESVVTTGEYAGKTLNTLVEQFGKDLVGSRGVDKFGDKFPLLIKFIDSNRDLSIQVHPDDELASRKHGSLGKTEMWYAVDRSIMLLPEMYTTFLPGEYMLSAQATLFSRYRKPAISHIVCMIMTGETCRAIYDNCM